MNPYINHLAGFGAGFIAFFPVAGEAASVNVTVGDTNQGSGGIGFGFFKFILISPIVF